VTSRSHVQKCRTNTSAVRRPFVKVPNVCVLPSLSNTSILRACDSSSDVSSLCAPVASEDIDILGSQSCVLNTTGMRECPWKRCRAGTSGVRGGL
jgi:hypothetical protein